MLFVTGTRADYGKLEGLALAAAAAGHKVAFFVTGMHMLERYGLTKTEVHRRSEFEVIEFVNQRAGDPQDIILAKTLIGFSDVVQEYTPDFVVLHGDRIEAFACASVCATNEVVSVHIEGGEVSGTIDEIFRHCNTKLSNFHLVSSEAAANRVRRLGEHPSNVKVIGSPELDFHNQPTGVSLAEVRERYKIDMSEYGICVLHPVTSEKKNARRQAEAVFAALEDSSHKFVVIQPNNDPGSEAIFDVISSLPKDKFRVLPSMRFSYFSELLRSASIIIGNSSLGVREAPFLGVPSVDIGSRQSNRSTALSVFHCGYYDYSDIVNLINSYWGVRFERSYEFGTGNAVNNFLALIRDRTFDLPTIQKYFVE